MDNTFVAIAVWTFDFKTASCDEVVCQDVAGNTLELAPKRTMSSIGGRPLS